jgi:hypothetical protein
MCGSAPQRFPIGFARAPDVHVVDRAERNELDRIDFDLAGTHSIPTAGLDLHIAPEPEGHGDVAGEHTVT